MGCWYPLLGVGGSTGNLVSLWVKGRHISKPDGHATTTKETEKNEANVKKGNRAEVAPRGNLKASRRQAAV